MADSGPARQLAKLGKHRGRGQQGEAVKNSRKPLKQIKMLLIPMYPVFLVP